MTNQMRRNSFAALYRQSYTENIELHRTENLLGRLRKIQNHVDGNPSHPIRPTPATGRPIRE